MTSAGRALGSQAALSMWRRLLVSVIAICGLLSSGFVTAQASAISASPSQGAIYTYDRGAQHAQVTYGAPGFFASEGSGRLSPSEWIGLSESPVAALHSFGVAAKTATRLEIQIGSKIEKQAVKRGWTNDSIHGLVNNPARTVSTRDTRWLPGGARNDAPATGYINRSGGYVVRNDETGDIVQVSDLNDPNWKSPW